MPAASVVILRPAHQRRGKSETHGRLDPRGAQKNFNGPDIRFYEQKLLPVKVRKGEFAMFLPPLGAHAPCCTDDGRKAVKKLVIKVLAD